MLRKCLRYDLKSVFTYWIFGAIAMLIMSIPTGLALRSQALHFGELGRFNWEILVILLAYFVGAAFLILSSILVYVRFYKHFFSDEGYLTFTLPVKRRTLFTSKVINGVIWQALTALVIIISIIIMVMFVPSDGGSTVPPVESEPLISGWWAFLYVLEALALIVIYSFTSVLAMYLVITIGANIVRKNKIIATIGIVYVSNVVLSLLSYLFVLLGISYVASINKVFVGAVSNPELLIFLALALAIVVLLTITVAIAMITLNIIERKLNLA